MDMPTDLLTLEQLQTLGGLAVAIAIIARVVAQLWPRGPIFVVALVVGIGLSLLATGRGEGGAERFVLAILNGCLATLVAVGGQETTKAIAVKTRTVLRARGVGQREQ